MVAVGDDEKRRRVVHRDGRPFEVLDDPGDDVVQVEYLAAHDQLGLVDA